MAGSGQEGPLVSIGMPIRNGWPYVEDALQSILDQTEQNFEIIISDNGSDDEGRDFLQKAADNDPRIKYHRPDPVLRAYDNFRYVLAKATGQYFMWAAHDDTRDPDFIAKMISALEENPDAVLAFGDINLVTPDDLAGEILPFPFQTNDMGMMARLVKLSQLQCFNIYGLWRTVAVKNIPYAYCAWWPDLPMILSAGVMGVFIHVPGTRFNYLELQKTGPDRVKYQDYAARFNLPLEVLRLIFATYRACSQIGGVAIGLYCAGLVFLKQVKIFPGFLYRRARRIFGG